MKRSLAYGLLGGLLLAVPLIDVRPVAAAEEEQVAQGKEEVLAKGPVHEAFARPTDTGKGQDGPKAPKAPKPLIEEEPPEEKPEGDNVQWIPGYWHWDDERNDFIWISGTWRKVPPGRRWVPGTWRPVEGGHQWSGGFWAPAEQKGMTYLPPPPDPVEVAPSSPSPGDDYNYVPGCWVYREDRYLWRPGYWLRCRPDWVWQSASYVRGPGGWCYNSGYWDYPLDQCGVLYAPVYWSGGYCPSYYRPYWTIGTGFLFASLFIHSGYGNYCYGDWFNNRYCTSWNNWRHNNHGCDSHYAHYRNRHGKNWDKDLKKGYDDRYAGRAERPPKNLDQQLALKDKNPNKVLDNNLAALKPIQENNRETKLEKVSKAERAEQKEQSQQFRKAAEQRTKLERDLQPKGGNNVLKEPRKVDLDLPKAKVTSNKQDFDRPGKNEKFERSTPRNVDQPKFERSTPRNVDQPKFERSTPRNVDQPKFERSAPRVTEQPKFERSAPREVDQPKFERSAPRVIEQPKFERSAPRIQESRPAPRIERSTPNFNRGGGGGGGGNKPAGRPGGGGGKPRR